MGMHDLPVTAEEQRISLERFRRRRVIIGGIVLAAIVALAGWQVNRLRPPSSMRLASGPEGEHEYAIAQGYQTYMAEQGVALEIVPTSGSLEMIDLVEAGEVDASFMLNAANFEADADGLVALAGVGHVPIWVFYRNDADVTRPFDDLTDLEGLRVSLGDAQSGTRAISKLLLGIAQIDESQLDVIEAGPEESADLLRNGEIDAMMLASGVNSAVLSELLFDPAVEIMDFRLAQTYARLVPFFQTVTLLEGSINLAARDPAEDKRLVTDATVLIADEALHPDLQLLLVRAAIATQNRNTVLFPVDEIFPSVDNLTLPVSETTRRYLNEGQTALERYLPFWVALPVERFYLLILPALLLLYPLLRNTPTAYGAFMRRRVYVYYKRLRELELGLERYTIAQLEQNIASLQSLQQQLTETLYIPTGYLQSFYNLRVHIRLVIDRMRERKAELTALGLEPNQLPPTREDESTVADNA